MKAFFKRTVTGLTPEDEQAAKTLRGIKPGEVIAVEVTRPRNIQHHRLFWAMVSKIAEAVDAEPENVADVLKIKTGHYVTVTTKSGLMMFPRSISFAKMDQAEFRDFFDRCCKVICAEFLPHMSAPEVQSEILNMLGINWPEAA